MPVKTSRRLHKSPSAVGRHHQAFHRDLTAGTLTWLTIGGVVGSGLFMASGIVIRHAGPAALGLYGLGALAMYLEIRALAEMSIANPTPGSFLVYTRQVLGPGWTFVAGWVFWFSSVLTMSSEVTAAALLTRYWFPSLPLWMWSLIYSVLVVALNFVSVRGFGTIEAVMAVVKTVAVLAFIAVTGVLLTGAFPSAGRLSPRFWEQPGGWLPHGWYGAAPAMLLVLFAYAGTGVIGLAAAESQNPSETLPRSIRASVLLIAVMAIGSIAAILVTVPWRRVPETASPFIAALEAQHIPYGPPVMNFVLLFAVLSTMNAALYANVRVLYGLARQGQAPRALGTLNRRGLPTRAIWTSAGLLVLTIGLAYILPHKAYAYLVTATGFQAMFIWLVVLYTELRYRRYLERHEPHKLTFPLFGYPYTTWAVIGFVALALALSPVARGELVGFIAGSAGILVAVLAFAVFSAKHRGTP